MVRRRRRSSSDDSSGSSVRTAALTISLLMVLAVQLVPQDVSSLFDETIPRSLQVQEEVVEDDFQLAYQQSYGFFDDIPSAQWKLHQKRAREHQNHANPAKPNSRWPNAPPAIFYMQNYDPFFTCPHVRRLGGAGDGPKWTCDAHRLARIAQDRKAQAAQSTQQQQQSNCLVYSIGCAGNYQWEEALAKSLMGPDGKQRDCEIHVFDFAGDFTVAGHVETYNIHFHKVMIKSSYDDSMARAWPKQAKGYAPWTYTLQEIVQKLGHEGHVIDILKVDCEFCEWFSYKDWLSPQLDVRQLLIETHNLPKPDGNPQSNTGGHWFPIATDVKPNQFFDDIENAGFAMFSKEPNIHPNSAGNGIEFAYIKLHPDFFRAETEGTAPLTTSRTTHLSSAYS